MLSPALSQLSRAEAREMISLTHTHALACHTRPEAREMISLGPWLLETPFAIFIGVRAVKFKV